MIGKPRGRGCGAILPAWMTARHKIPQIDLPQKHLSPLKGILKVCLTPKDTKMDLPPQKDNTQRDLPPQKDITQKNLPPQKDLPPNNPQMDIPVQKDLPPKDATRKDIPAKDPPEKQSNLGAELLFMWWLHRRNFRERNMRSSH
jgi:hypothetical protein